LCGTTYTSSANNSKKKYHDFDCDGLLSTHKTAKVLFTRAAGRVSIVSVGLLHECDCTQSYFIGSLLSSSTVTVNVGDVTVFETFTITDSISTLCGVRDGTDYCGNLTPVLFSLRDAGTNNEVNIGTVTVTGTNA
jgi:hypothetical protein